MPTQPVYRPEGSGKSFWLILDKMTPKIHFDETGGEMSLHVVECPPGGGPPPHLHKNEDEVFFVLEGEYSFLKNDTLVRCPAGKGVLGERQVVHTFKNTGQGWSKMLCFAVGGPFERFAMEMADPSTDMTTPPPVTQARIDQIMALTPKYGIEMKLDWPPPTKQAEMPAPKERYWVLGSRVDFVVTGAQSNHRFFVTDVTTWPSFGPPPHVHTGEGECFYVIEGEFEMLLGTQKCIARKGDAVYAPPGTPHTFKCISSKPGRFLSFHHGRGIEGFFREVGVPASDPHTPPTFADDFDRIVASALRNGMTLAK